MKYVLIFTALAALLLALALPQSEGEISTFLPDVVNGLEFITEVGGTDESGDISRTILHLIPGLLESGQESVTNTKTKRDDTLSDIENLLASGENEVTGSVDEALGLDGIFPVERRERSLRLERRDEGVVSLDTVVVDAVGQVEETLEAAPLLEGTV
jgi:hypothetical protein